MWVLIIVGGAYLYKRYKGGSTATATPPVAVDPSIDPATGVSYAAEAAGLGSSGTIASTPSATQTNAQWASSSASALIAGGASPTQVNNALAKYLAGTALTPAEAAIVNQAIAKYGEPPQGILPITLVPVVTPKPVPKPVAAPPPHEPTPKHPTPKPVPKPGPRTYVVKSGDSLSSIASHYYGSPDWQKLYNANKGVIGGNPNVIHPGQRLVIPS